MEHVWPGIDPDRSISNLRGRISEIRKILEPDLDQPQKSRFIKTAKGGYRFDSANAQIDTEQFKQLFHEARQLEDDGQLNEAAQCYRQAIDLYQNDALIEEDAEWAVACRNELRSRYLQALERAIQTHMASGQTETAIEFARQSLEINPYQEAIYRLLMECHRQAGQYREALVTYDECRETFERELGLRPSPETTELQEQIKRRVNHLTEQERLESELETLRDKQDPASYLRKIDIHHHLGNRDAEFNAIQETQEEVGQEIQGQLQLKLARYYNHLGRFKEAYDHAMEAMKTLEAQDDATGVLTAASIAGTSCYNMADHDQAETHYYRIIELAGKLRDDRAKANALRHLGLIEKRRGHYQRALSLLDQSYRINLKRQDREEQAIDLFNIGSLYHYQGLFGQAMFAYERVRDVAERLAFPYLRALSLSNMGTILKKEGQYDRAIRQHEALLRERDQIQDHRIIAANLHNLGLLYEKVGQYLKAKKLYEGALGERTAEDHWMHATGLHNLGRVLVELGHVQEGQGHIQDAYELFESEAEDRWWQIHCRITLGTVHEKQGNNEQAHDCYDSALEGSRELDNQELEMLALSHLVLLHADNPPDGMIRWVDELHDVLTSYGETEHRILAEWALHHGFRASGREEKAIKYLKGAHTELMARHDLLGDHELRQSFLNNVHFHREIQQTYTS